MKMRGWWGKIPVLLLVPSVKNSWLREVMQIGIDEVLVYPVSSHQLAYVLDEWVYRYERKRGRNPHRAAHAHGEPLTIYRYKDHLWKRTFDVVVALGLILFLLPFLLLIALAIKLESKGPVIYYSKRVGTGYKIFKFYKFRSMYQNADQLIDQVKAMNHYASEPEVVTAGPGKMEMQEVLTTDLASVFIADDLVYREQDYQQLVEKEINQSFIKVANDPCITRVGRFLRNTSLDEIPQLFNVLQGDMSLVGNRPLPLYEAEKLTSDDWVRRFMAPAGMTGLWQVTERGKEITSEESKKKLDVVYAEQQSFWLDLKILFKTPLATLQHENV
jgi:lipopolysaccharide/colanic/teichoic acid biosynthesis glycosyltransferase